MKQIKPTPKNPRYEEFVTLKFLKEFSANINRWDAQVYRKLIVWNNESSTLMIERRASL